MCIMPLVDEVSLSEGQKQTIERGESFFLDERGPGAFPLALILQYPALATLPWLSGLEPTRDDILMGDDAEDIGSYRSSEPSYPSSCYTFSSLSTYDSKFENRKDDMDMGIDTVITGDPGKANDLWHPKSGASNLLAITGVTGAPTDYEFNPNIMESMKTTMDNDMTVSRSSKIETQKGKAQVYLGHENRIDAASNGEDSNEDVVDAELAGPKFYRQSLSTGWLSSQ